MPGLLFLDRISCHVIPLSSALGAAGSGSGSPRGGVGSALFRRALIGRVGGI